MSHAGYVIIQPYSYPEDKEVTWYIHCEHYIDSEDDEDDDCNDDDDDEDDADGDYDITIS